MTRAALLLCVLAAMPALAGEPSTLEVTKLSYTAGKLKLTASLTYQGERRKTPVWVRVTLRKPRDPVAFELPAKELAPGDLAKPIVFDATVGPGFIGYSLTAWGRKVPCDGTEEGAARARCGRWGAWLDEPLASVPPAASGEARGEGFVIFEPLDIRIVDAGAGEEETRTAIAAIGRTAALATSGRGEVIAGEAEPKPRAATEVLYRDGPQAERAQLLRRQLLLVFPEKKIEVRQWPQATDAFVIALAK